jgi:hypothetical protein
MAGTTPIYGFPYPESSDLVANYPALGQQLAEDVEDVLAAGFGKILQVVAYSAASNVSTTSSTYVTTNITATITPSSATNKVLIVASNNFFTDNNLTKMTLFRGTVAGTNLGSGGYVGFGLLGNYNGSIYTELHGTLTASYLDSPATTSAQVYTVGFASITGGSSSICNLSASGTITLMEVGA